MHFKGIFLFTLLGLIFQVVTSETTCAENEEYAECVTPAACVSTCAQPYVVPCYMAVCSGGCQCKAGYIRSEIGGPCVVRQQCQAFCGPNQEFSTCGSACSVACNTKNLNCTGECVVGCFCKREYILNYVLGGSCISETECSTIHEQ